MDELAELASATDEIDACMGVTGASGRKSREYFASTFLSLSSEVWPQGDVDVGLWLCSFSVVPDSREVAEAVTFLGVLFGVTEVGSDLGDASDTKVSSAAEVPSIV